MHVRLVLLSALLLGVSTAKADTLENLSFTGTTTCNFNVNQECSPVGGHGAITGNYTLDITTDTIVGAWSFTTIYGDISSSDAFPFAHAGTFTFASVLYDSADFQISPLETLGLAFTAPNLDQLGTVAGNGLSSICQNVSTNGCAPDLNIAGSTTLVSTVVTPEPSSFALMSTALLAFAFVARKRFVAGVL